MNQIASMWLPFNVLEAILAALAAAVHITGMVSDFEPLPHVMYFCGTYCAFFFISILGIVGMCFGSRSPILMEVIISAAGTLLFFTTAIFSLYYAEGDFHLMYLINKEEAEHPFFLKSKAQSILSLFAAVTYLLHFTFAIDAMIIKDDSAAQAAAQLSNSPESDDYSALRPIKTNLGCWSYLLQFEVCAPCLDVFYNNEEEKDTNEKVLYDKKGINKNKKYVKKSINEEVSFDKKNEEVSFDKKNEEASYDKNDINDDLLFDKKIINEKVLYDVKDIPGEVLDDKKDINEKSKKLNLKDRMKKKKF